jgi:hypothetical protein
MIARILFLLCLLLPGTLSAQDKPEVPALEEPVTLTVWQRDIAVFRATLGSLTPNIRRENALQRISDLPKGALYDEVRTEKISVSGIQGVSFLSGKRLLFTLVEADADTDTGTTLAVTANEVLKNLEALRRARLEQRSLPLILRGAGISVIATLVFAGFLWGLGRLGTIIRGFFVRRAARISHLNRRDLDLRPAFLQISRRVTGFVLSAIGLTAAYLWITAVLAQFPYTAAWAELLGHNVALVGGTLLSSALSSLPNILIVIALFFLTRGIVRLTDQILRSFESSDEVDQILARDTARATRRIASVLIWIFGMVIAYPYIPGSDSEAFKGISVLIGLVISLGSTGLVSNPSHGWCRPHFPIFMWNTSFASCPWRSRAKGRSSPTSTSRSRTSSTSLAYRSCRRTLRPSPSGRSSLQRIVGSRHRRRNRGRSRTKIRRSTPQHQRGHEVASLLTN